MFNDVFVDEGYDIALSKLALQQQRPIELLDLGANVGYFSLRAADALLRQGVEFRITAVEGNPRTYQALRRRLLQERNSLIAPRCHSFHFECA
jgi:predicted O-methyltransferase YrrM